MANPSIPAVDAAAPCAIRMTGLTKRFGDKDALDALDLEVRRGEVMGYLGPNGAGKTTTLRLLLGALRPTAGHAEIFGLDVTTQAVQAHARLAYVAGEANLWPRLTGMQTLDLLGRLHGGVDERYRHELVRHFDLDTSRRIRELSKGNRQKVALIAALSTRADLLLLDEPTSGLDPLMEEQFRAAMQEARGRGQTVLLSSHILAEVEALSDRIAILRNGTLADLGSLEQLRHLSAVSVDIDFAGDPPDLRGVPGVGDVRVTGRTATCHVSGPMQPLLERLSGCAVTRLLSREPTLEELFLRHYDRTGSDDRPGDDAHR